MSPIFRYRSPNAPFFHKTFNFGDVYLNKPYFLRKKDNFRYASSKKLFFFYEKKGIFGYTSSHKPYFIKKKLFLDMHIREVPFLCFFLNLILNVSE